MTVTVEVLVAVFVLVLVLVAVLVLVFTPVLVLPPCRFETEVVPWLVTVLFAKVINPPFVFVLVFVLVVVEVLFPAVFVFKLLLPFKMG